MAGIIGVLQMDKKNLLTWMTVGALAFALAILLMQGEAKKIFRPMGQAEWVKE